MAELIYPKKGGFEGRVDLFFEIAQSPEGGEDIGQIIETHFNVFGIGAEDIRRNIEWFMNLAEGLPLRTVFREARNRMGVRRATGVKKIYPYRRTPEFQERLRRIGIL